MFLSFRLAISGKSYNDEKSEKEGGKANLIADFFDFYFDELFSNICCRRNLKTQIVFRITFIESFFVSAFD